MRKLLQILNIVCIVFVWINSLCWGEVRSIVPQRQMLQITMTALSSTPSSLLVDGVTNMVSWYIQSEEVGDVGELPKIVMSVPGYYADPRSSNNVINGINGDVDELSRLITLYLKLLAEKDLNGVLNLYDEVSRNFINDNFTAEDQGLAFEQQAKMRDYDVKMLLFITEDYVVTFGTSKRTTGTPPEISHLSFKRSGGVWCLRAGKVDVPFFDVLTVRLFEQDDEHWQVTIQPEKNGK